MARGLATFVCSLLWVTLMDVARERPYEVFAQISEDGLHTRLHRMQNDKRTPTNLICMTIPVKLMTPAGFSVHEIAGCVNTGHGMPSNHTQYMFFFASFATLYLWGR